MTTFDKAANDLLAQVWGDIQKRGRERELAAVKANPEKHRMTRLMAAGASTGYTYVSAGEKKIGSKKMEQTKFCRASHKNAAGVFLIWRQVDRYKRRPKGRRDQLRGRGWEWYETQRYDFQWAPTRAEAMALIRRKAERHKADAKAAAIAKLPDAPAEARAMLDAAIDSYHS